MLYYGLVILLLLFLGATISATLAEKTDAFDRQPIYRSDSFVKLINLFWLPSVILFGVLMYMDWKITLPITIVGLFLGGKVLKPIAEYVIILPLFKLLARNE